MENCCGKGLKEGSEVFYSHSILYIIMYSNVIYNCFSFGISDF